ENTNCKTNAMMARAVIRKPEIPCFVLNSQVRVADWEQVCGTHQGQQQIPTLRPKAGHRTVLTNRATNAFFSCKADAIHTGQTRLLQVRLLLTQKPLASATDVSPRCNHFRRSGLLPCQKGHPCKPSERRMIVGKWTSSSYRRNH
ncbi:hypothetical protein, partial [Tritonibacter multivorans]|uniref:hypothetical protein n=1 Tax=Tritonibacter multivorans TaxID=928856 RepID=UPI001A93B9A8